VSPPGIVTPTPNNGTGCNPVPVVNCVGVPPAGIEPLINIADGVIGVCIVVLSGAMGD